MKKINLLKEFIRYLFVGGTAFFIDFFILYILKTYVFYGLNLFGIYISTALGFIGGLIYNYIMSLLYVFESAKDENSGKSIKSFIIFALIGVVGLILTEIGMYVGVGVMTINYMIVKVIVAGVVLIWNYGARKILIFKMR
jgi:putative flippase GtrA